VIRRATLLDDVTRLVARHFDLSVAALRGPGRTARVALARQVVFYLAHRHGGATLGRIGLYFSRHHTTVLHGVQRIQTLLRAGDPVSAVVLRVIPFISQVTL